ncbi:MAG: hypothetical protein K9G70_07575 [Prolixibacteraceae bacterium]|nr:hypothetical protein [Prolixibacteraceae bacterium]
MNNQQHNANNSEVEFELIWLYSFFNDENDKNINWAEFFQITEESLFLMKAQEQNGTVNILNEPEEEAWNEL